MVWSPQRAMPSPSSPRYGLSGRRAVPFLVGAVLALTAGPVAAQVLTAVVVVSPGGGAMVSSGEVVVEIRGLGKADSVEARVLAAGAAAGPRGLAGDGQQWRGSLDLSALPNGPARVEARAVFGGSSPTDWDGHEIRLDFPAPHTPLQASPVAPGAVALTWQAAPIPDVSGYEVQRALGDGGFEGLVTVKAGQHAHTDTGVPGGSHRYRVRVLRPGGAGGTKAGPWAESGVAVAGPGPGGGGGGQGGDTSAQASSGVATAPRTGGIAARLRAGSESLPAPDISSLAPQVAPRDLGQLDDFDDLPAGDDLAGLGAEEMPRLTDSGLAVMQENPLGSDAVRLVGLGLIGLLALYARWVADRPRRAARGPNGLLFETTGDEVWRGARDWSRSRPG